MEGLSLIWMEGASSTNMRMVATGALYWGRREERGTERWECMPYGFCEVESDTSPQSCDGKRGSRMWQQGR